LQLDRAGQEVASGDDDASAATADTRGNRVRNASVLSVVLLPTAPNAVTSKSRLGKTGGLMRARMAGTWRQGSSRSCAQMRGTEGTAPARVPAARAFKKVRRSVIACSFCGSSNLVCRDTNRQIEIAVGVREADVAD